MLKFFKSKGFTLIELLVVLAILVLLISVILVYMGPSRQKARDSRRESDIRQIGLAAELYYDEAGNYPPASSFSNLINENYLNDYLPDVPNDSLQGRSYHWVNNSALEDRDKYCLYAILESSSVTTYFCSSERGVNSSAVLPTLGLCCFD